MPPIKTPILLPWLFAATLAVSGVAVAQRLSPPDAKETRSPTERAAYDKALCVYRAMTDAGKVFTPATGDTKITPEIQARAKVELDQFEQVARRGVSGLLTARSIVSGAIRSLRIRHSLWAVRASSPRRRRLGSSGRRTTTTGTS